MKNKYDDIIHLPHHVSKSRPRMSITNRAAQFSPFAALTGHGDAIKETGRLTDKKIVLGEDHKSYLDRKLQILEDEQDSKPHVIFTYFLPDEQKEGGSYITASGTVKKIDAIERVIVLTDTTVIPIEDVLEIESNLFTSLT